MKKSILICCEALANGGIGTFTLTLARGLQERGWEVRGLVTTRRGELFDDFSRLARPCTGLWDLPLSPRKVRHVASIIEESGVEVVLLNHAPLVHYALPLVSRYVRSVAVLHNDLPAFYKPAARFASRVSGWVAPTTRLARGISKHLPRGARGRVFVVHHGIDISRFASAAHAGVPRERRVLFVGHVGRNKGADRLPAILAPVALRVPDMLVTVVGEGPDSQSLQRQFTGAGVHAHFLGHVAQAVVAEEMRHARVLLLPSRVEGFGLVLAEAMAAGVVPVCAWLEGITDEVVEHGRTGFLVPGDDLCTFAHYVGAMLSDDLAWSSTSEDAAKAAAQRFSLERMLDDYESLFLRERGLGSPGRVGPLGWWAACAKEFLVSDLRDGSWLNHGLRLIKYAWQGLGRGAS